MKNVAPKPYFFNSGRTTVKCDLTESSNVSTTAGPVQESTVSACIRKDGNTTPATTNATYPPIASAGSRADSESSHGARMDHAKSTSVNAQNTILDTGGKRNIGSSMYRRDRGRRPCVRLGRSRR